MGFTSSLFTSFPGFSSILASKSVARLILLLRARILLATALTTGPPSLSAFSTAAVDLMVSPGMLMAANSCAR